MTVAHVLAGGEPIPDSCEGLLGLGAAADVVIAADSGAESAASAGLFVDVLVAISTRSASQTLDAVIDWGTSIEAHHPDKDATDCGTGARDGPSRWAPTRDRGRRRWGASEIDHLLGNVAVISQPHPHDDVQVRWELERESAYVVHSRRTIPVTDGSTFSVIPVARRRARCHAHGIEVECSTDATLDRAGASLGISNTAAAELTVEVNATVPCWWF